MNKDNVSPVIELVRTHKDKNIRLAAIQSFKHYTNIPLNWIGEALNDEESSIRLAATDTFATRDDIPLEFIEKALNDKDSADIRYAAVSEFKKRNDIPMEWFIKALRDDDVYIRFCAAKALRNEDDIPTELLEIILNADEHVDIRVVIFDILLDIYFGEDNLELENLYQNESIEEEAE